MMRCANPSRCVIGTVGQPGSRAFFFQVRGVFDADAGPGVERVVSVGLEKQQADALAEKIDQLLSRGRDVGLTECVVPEVVTDLAPLELPLDQEFAAGIIALSLTTSPVRVELELFDQDSDPEASDNPAAHGGVSVSLSVEQAGQFVARTRSVVAAGRPPCPFCELPLDAGGHVCPRANGYRR